MTAIFGRAITKERALQKNFEPMQNRLKLVATRLRATTISKVRGAITIREANQDKKQYYNQNN